MYKDIIKDLQKLRNPEKIEVYKWFFKTGPSQYGEGDKFLGLTTQEVKNIANKYYKECNLTDIENLLKHPIHEVRMAGVRIIVSKFTKAEESEQKQIYNFYLKNAQKINNWDLVDVSAHKVVGVWLLARPDRKVLYKLAKSKNLWEKRIAIISTFAFIKNHDFADTLKISKILLQDQHDLIHKAVGWMLREIGKIDRKVEEDFLKKHYQAMPRTMLRYAIEKFPEDLRQMYLKNKI